MSLSLVPKRPVKFRSNEKIVEDENILSKHSLSNCRTKQQMIQHKNTYNTNAVEAVGHRDQ